MTTPAHQRARAIVSKWDKHSSMTFACPQSDVDTLVTAITVALEAEREACAKVVEQSEWTFPENYGTTRRDAVYVVVKQIAAAIRRRKDTV